MGKCVNLSDHHIGGEQHFLNPQGGLRRVPLGVPAARGELGPERRGGGGGERRGTRRRGPDSPGYV